MEKLHQADKDTIIVFDCDDVLIEAEDAILRYKNEKIFKEMCANALKKMPSSSSGNSDAIYDYFYSIVMQSYKTRLVNQLWPPIIKYFQENQIKVLLLTACRGGKVGVVQSMSELRKQQLLKFHIDFSKSWTNVSCVDFASSDVMFKDGMIFSGKTPKDQALKMFLEKVPCKKIIFIDDRDDHIESVRKMSDSLGIEFIGIHYEKYNNNEKLNIDIIREQLKTLIDRKEWISEKDLMKKCIK